MPENTIHRFTMLEECGPLNPPAGMRRTVSLDGDKRFTMAAEAQRVKTPANIHLADVQAELVAPEPRIEAETEQLPIGSALVSPGPIPAQSTHSKPL
jgi:hypothetical protein